MVRVSLFLLPFLILQCGMSYQNPVPELAIGSSDTLTGLVGGDQSIHWPWHLMHEDMMWAIDILQDSNTSIREKRMASTIMQAWLGQVEEMRVFHQENGFELPIDA